jgi:hypothetical protein
MDQQPSTFHPFPEKNVILRRIEMMERRLAGPVSYLLYILPLAERFGDRVYEVAAESLRGSGVDVTAEELKRVAAELKTPEGHAKYARDRMEHIWAITPLRFKEGEDW